MSRVILLCADHPLPLYAAQTRRVYFHRGVRYEEEGFSVQPHVYYRPAVDNLELSMKPHRYELDLRATEQDAALREAFRRASLPHAPAEPLDWMETTCPARWRTDEGEIEYDWDDDFGAEPLKR